jgi:hypothetical protein
MKQGADPVLMIAKDCTGSLHRFVIVCCSTFMSQTTQGPTDGFGEGEGPGEGPGTGLEDGDRLGLGDGEGEAKGDGRDSWEVTLEG